MKQGLLRQLPKIDDVLKDRRIEELMERIHRETVVDAVRRSVESLRADILDEKITEASEMKLDSMIDRIIKAAEELDKRSLRPVINATGVVLHTNLGRAVLSEKAVEQVAKVARGYSTLEYDPEKGERGSRHVHAEKLLKDITGAEACMVVNNNAANVMLALAAIGRSKEMIVSRGELVEIGGSFRVPDIMAESGVRLVEVGTTNKTRAADYENHITEDTAALLKVHTSNYRIIGFTEEASLRELRELGDKYGIPVIYDMGSGLMVDLSPWGIREPVVTNALKEGADLVLFSGDKLLGGPQAGIAVGRSDIIARMKKHPLARVVRADKMTFAALEATLLEYLDTGRALENIPVLRMISRPEEELKEVCLKLKGDIDEIMDPATGRPAYITKVQKEDGVVGGGSAPDSKLRSQVLVLTSEAMSPDTIEKLLRKGEPPIVVRIHNEKVIFDVRTLKTEDLKVITERLKEMVSE